MAKWKSGARGGRPDRGGGGFRGSRGRGNNDRGRAQGPGRGRGHSYSGSNGSIQDDFDVTLQTYADAPSAPKLAPETFASPRGRAIPAFRGRGRGGPLIPLQLSSQTFPGRGRGFDIPRRQVQGIGAKNTRLPVPVGPGAKQTLSSLLERPLLKQIIFVPSTETRFLFQNEEELLQPIVEDVGDTIQSPIPTADRVTRVFSGGNIPRDIWDNDEDGTDDEIESVDFNDVGKLFHARATTSKTTIPKHKTELVPVETVHEEFITRNGNRETQRLPADITEVVNKSLSSPNSVNINANHPLYDTQPKEVPNGIGFHAIQHPVLPGDDDDDDIIVYEAPHPRKTPNMYGREKESTEDVTTIPTTNGQIPVDISRYSFDERPVVIDKEVVDPIEQELSEDMKRVLGMLDKGKGRLGENLKQANHDINNDHGMEVDVDVDIATLERFARRLTGPDAGTYVSMDELSESGNDDDEGDDDDDEEDEDDLDDEDEDDYEDGSSHLKLNRLRLIGGDVNGDVEDEDDLLQRNMTLADQDEAFIRYLDDALDDKYQDLPPELSIQFELDRQKKAERKRERKLERLAIAADPLSRKKGGKKGRKAMLAAAAVDPTITVVPNRVIDMTTLVQQIRRFIADVGGPSSMSLPPTDKQTRKDAHEIAAAFNLKSVSKGKGDTRYTTLTKTPKTGFQVNEGKIARIVRSCRARGDSFISEDKKGNGVSRVPRQKEGDVVGMAAPKLDESNVGFRLLAMMGWSEGDRIGASTNGLEGPLTAIIKTSKLGLGARK